MTGTVLPLTESVPASDRISTLVWTGVLLTSLVFHVFVLKYGIPDLTFTEPRDETVPPPTEIIIESGGLRFDGVETVSAEQLSATIPEILAASSVGVAQSVRPEISSASPPKPQVDAVEPIGSMLETAELVDPDMLSELAVVETVPVAPVVEAVDAHSPEPDLTAELAQQSALVVSAVEPDKIETVSPQNVTAGPAPEPTLVLPQTSETVPVNAIPIPSVQNSGTLATPGLTAIDSVDQVVNAVSVDITAEAFDNISVVDSVPVDAATIDAEPGPVDTVQESAMAVAAVSENPTPVTPVAPVAEVVQNVTVPSVVPSLESGAENVIVSPEFSTIPLTTIAPTPEIPSVEPEATVDTEPVLQVQEVVPVDQQIAAVNLQSGVEPLQPAMIDPDPVTEAPVPAGQTEIASPPGVATIDPTEQVAAYVASYELGDCAHLTVQSAGANSASLTAFGASIAPFALFDQQFSSKQGFEASIEVRLVTRQQCQLLNVLGLFNGLETPGLISLDKTVVRSGTAISGVIERDLPLERIAIAEQSGLLLNGAGPPEVYLVDDAGRIHDGRTYLLPFSDRTRAGGWRFSIPVTLLSQNKEETALVLTVWNRPKHLQPTRFGRLSADRIAEVLESPGVYSLAAFKVTR